MKNFTTLSLLFAFFVAAGCNKPEPNPEVRDPIYLDYLQELDLAKKELEAEEKTLDEHETAYKAVQPQTGQVKYAKKRVEESSNRVSHLKQRVQYFELKLASRLSETRASYLRAFHESKPWPSAEEAATYSMILKLRRDKIAADKNQRIPAANSKPQAKKEAAAPEH